MVTFNNFPKIIVISLVLLTVLISGCKDDKVIKPLPIIKTTEIFSLGSNAVTIKSELFNAKDLDITSAGLYWSNHPDPKFENFVVQGDIDSSLIYCRITGLSPHTTYYAKVYATNSSGTSYGEEISFTTNNTVADIDGNIYNTVTIGTQTWMVENLKTTKFNDGVEIPYLSENVSYDNPPSAFYCFYLNSISTREMYGALYNFPAVNSGKLCPVGWHIPSDAEWTTLTNLLGGEPFAGGLLKETGTSWFDPNHGANNYSGFSALPGGSVRVSAVSFLGLGYTGIWWTSTIDGNDFIIYRAMSFETTQIDKNGFSAKADAINGLSVRCIKD